MRYTNNLGLPQPLVNAVLSDPYTRGESDYSVTGLLRPPRMTALEREYWDRLTEDVSERLWSLFGQITHSILERGESPIPGRQRVLSEERLFVDLYGKRISGQIDRFLLLDGKLQDYKFVTLWKFKNGVPKEFEAQLNCYVFLLRRNGYEVATAEIVAMFRDWHRPSSFKVENYPPTQAMIFPVRLWEDRETEEFLIQRIVAHETAVQVLPLCTDEDRWKDPDQWAVMKHGVKRAVRLCSSEDEAREHIVAFSDRGGDEYTIQLRSGDIKRCPYYCRVSEFCDQWKAEQV